MPVLPPDDLEEVQYQYDSDFTQDSSPPASESESDAPHARAPLDPALAALIPREFYARPAFPPDFVWVCPLGDCRHTIDLLNLTDEDVRGARRGGQRVFLRRQPWKVGDEQRTRMFYDLVSAHWQAHMPELGLELAVNQDGVKEVSDVLLFFTLGSADDDVTPCSCAGRIRVRLILRQSSLR
ncbi:hypothetical protein BV25DRAFT_1818582 [Artomyces pyxidatus]|uniref:Uncharacterized protein n=1 Tax=Artomyces pyxidatus TaxID=48021 RepID=A0ACB8TIJ4_9AGAM|nr:hypothetical protein BV25DRAFT_1818582 [Artomyces pyxidatus]